MQSFRKKLHALGKKHLDSRNPVARLLLLGRTVSTVGADGRLTPKFGDQPQPQLQRDKFECFPGIDKQLTVLFETQLDILYTLLDVYLRMCRSLLDHLGSDPSAKGTSVGVWRSTANGLAERD